VNTEYVFVRIICANSSCNNLRQCETVLNLDRYLAVNTSCSNLSCNLIFFCLFVFNRLLLLLCFNHILAIIQTLINLLKLHFFSYVNGGLDRDNR